MLSSDQYGSMVHYKESGPTPGPPQASHKGAEIGSDPPASPPEVALTPAQPDPMVMEIDGAPTVYRTKASVAGSKSHPDWRKPYFDGLI